MWLMIYYTKTDTMKRVYLAVLSMIIGSMKSLFMIEKHIFDELKKRSSLSALNHDFRPTLLAL